MAKLTMLKCKAALKPGLHPDGGTLYLRVAPGGSRSWIQRMVIQGKRRDVGLGGFPLVSLSEAREMAFDNRRLARRGEDPVKRSSNVPTFRGSGRKDHRGHAPEVAVGRTYRIHLATHLGETRHAGFRQQARRCHHP